MMLRLALRSLLTRPLRTAALAAGFGFGIAVMAELLGVGEVILEQAHSPALEGGGHVVVAGALGSVDNARFIMSTVLGDDDLGREVRAASPSKRSRLVLITPRGRTGISARGGIPSLEKAIGDPEVAAIPSWTDTAADARWSRPQPGDILRAMDRFHAVPDAPAFTRSWAEWLYFNGRTPDGRVRFYLTFLVGSHTATPGKRAASVRLQLERDGRTTTHSASGQIDEAQLLARAPDLDIAGNRVRLEGLSYRLTLALDDVKGEIVLDGVAGRSMPPAAVRGAGGWLSGYVVPVLSGAVRGALTVGGTHVGLDDATGYHDHNWGFWQGVRWQWGQVAHDELSIVYGRVFPPADVADADRVPGLLAVLGPDGPIGFSTDVAIDDTGEPGHIAIRARGSRLDLQLVFAGDATIRTPMALTRDRTGTTMDFLQLGGVYRVTGRVGGRAIDFSGRGAAETFRSR